MRATFRTAGFVAGAVVGLPALLAAQTADRVSMEEALELFGERSLALQIARAEAAEMTGVARQSRAYFNPSLLMVHENLGRDGDDYSETIVGVEQRIEWPGRTAARGRVATHSADAAAAAFRADSLRLAFDVRVAYAGAWAAEEREAALRATLDLIGAAAEDAEIRLEEGDISGYDTRRLRLERVRAEGDLAAAELESAAARRHLADLVLGDSGGRELAPSDPLANRPPAVSGVSPADALATRPDIEAANSALEAVRSSVSAAGSGWLTDPTLMLGYKDQTDGFSGAALSVALPLPLFDRRGGAADAERARASAASAVLDLRRREARSDVLGASARYEVTRDRFERVGDGLVAEAEALLGAASAAYDEGELSLLEMLDAADAFRAARLGAVSLTANAWIAYYDLLRALGRAPEEDR